MTKKHKGYKQYWKSCGIYNIENCPNVKVGKHNCLEFSVEHKLYNDKDMEKILKDAKITGKKKLVKGIDF